MTRTAGGGRALAVLWVGRRPPSPWGELARDYADRVARFVRFEERRLRPSAGRGGDLARALAAEAVALRSHLDDRDYVIALDDRGREPSTEELAVLLRTQWDGGRRVVFVIGSDLGLDASFKASARERVALSRLTLPHHLARVVLFEQLYRVCDLLAGGRYHRSDSGDYSV